MILHQNSKIIMGFNIILLKQIINSINVTLILHFFDSIIICLASQVDALYDPLLIKTYQYIDEDLPRAKNYKSDASIKEAFPHLKDINDPNFNLESLSNDAKFFLMTSNNDDDIHKVLFFLY